MGHSCGVGIPVLAGMPIKFNPINIIGLKKKGKFSFDEEKIQ